MNSVSAVIPTYNRARSIGRTIDRILNQTHMPSEIIIVNDGSTDDTASIVSAYAPAVRLINIANIGPTGARSIGVQAAVSEWLAFCDSDDRWHPDHLSRLVGVAGSEGTPFAFSNFTHVTNGQKAKKSHFECDPHGFWMSPGRSVGNGGFVADDPLFARVLSYQAIFPSCTLMRRDFFERVGGLNPAFGRNPSDDLEFTLRCVKEKPAGIVVRPTVDIHRHGQNHSGDWIRTIAGSIAILKYARENHGLSAEYREAVDREIVSRCINGIDCCFAQRRFDDVALFAENLTGAAMQRKTAIKIAVARQPKTLALFLGAALAAGGSGARLWRSFRNAGAAGLTG
jgi:glycosyltransferase involved in cell wall biosynthesis